MKLLSYALNAEEMCALGGVLSKHLQPGSSVFLKGDLGAGKTTFARGFLNARGFERVKSPTFTLVESYEQHEIQIHHFDFYRFTDAAEAEYMGLPDYFNPHAICLIEWPENVLSLLPKPTVCCTIQLPEKGDGRYVYWFADTDSGVKLLNALNEELKEYSWIGNNSNSVSY
jgi:tRNA threonylcarbamoyladenosine biosynthesis protein TsaE